MSYPIRRGSNMSTQVIVKDKFDLIGELRSDVVYVIDGTIDMGSNSIVVPRNGLSIIGLTFDVSSIFSSEDNATLFVSEVGGSGNLLLRGLSLRASGIGSKVYDLTSFDGTPTIELNRVNYIECASLGTVFNYRQFLEDNTARFGGSPELTFDGNWNGARISTSLTRGISNISALFKAGSTLTFSGRFISDMNCDLPATGAYFDFSESNFLTEASLNLKDGIVTRLGIVDTSDTTTHPNIDDKSVKSFWSGNTGISNTQKYIRSTLTAEVETVISVIDEYVPILGTFSADKLSHFTSPSNGEFRLDSGNGAYQIFGDLTLSSFSGNVLQVRVVRSLDGGVTFSDEIYSTTRSVNALSGPRDVAFFTINSIESIERGDILRIEARNRTSTANIKAELSGSFAISGL